MRWTKSLKKTDKSGRDLRADIRLGAVPASTQTALNRDLAVLFVREIL